MDRVHTNKSFNPSRYPIEVMTAINCSYGRARRTEWEGEKQRRRERLRFSWVGAELGLTGEMGPNGPGPRLPGPLFLFFFQYFFFSFFSSTSLRRPMLPFLFLLFFDGRATRMPQAWDPRWRGSGSRNRACKTSVKAVLSEPESMGKQWADRS